MLVSELCGRHSRELGTLTVRHLLLNISKFSFVDKAIQFSDFLCTVLDKHVFFLCGMLEFPNSFHGESIRVKREQRRVERKWRNTKLAIFNGSYTGNKNTIFQYSCKQLNDYFVFTE